MSTEENKSFVRQFLERAWNQGDLSAVDQFLAADYVIHASAAEDTQGREGYQAAVATFRSAFPDYHTTIEEMLADGDRVIVRARDRGTQRGDFMGIAASGRQVSTPWISIYRVAAGRIVEEWICADQWGLMHQLGGVLAPGSNKPTSR